jgi:hypothetical protein
MRAPTKEDGMKPRQMMLLPLMVLLGLPAAAPAQQGTQGTVTPTEQQRTYPDPGSFEIDWERQVIVTNSLGAPATNLPRSAWRTSALRAARLAAYRDLLEAIKGVAVNSTTTVENAMVSSDVIKTRIEGIVRDFVVLDTKYYESMDVGVIVEMPLTGALTEAVVPLTGGPGTAGANPTPHPVKMTGGVVSGLVVDATGLDVTPAMAPKVLDEDGNEVYGSTKVDRQWAIKQGVAGYHRSVQGASTSDRMGQGGSPMVVKAMRTTGPNGCDLVISNADAARIRQAAGNQPFLTECRVMIVLGAQ